MPWKNEESPYKIWLSEIILQQTRVEQGTQYFLRFTERFPDIDALAAAADDEVFKLWEGLGYYSRCKNLLVTARYVSRELNGIFPNKYEDILQLKGIGPYTAAAIASFAFNADFAVVDGNVYRVLSRFFGIHTAIDSTLGKNEMAALAKAVLPAGKSARYNQAIMDFGATVCKPRQPLCAICIMKKDCFAFQNNCVSELPVKEKSLQKRHRWFYYFIIQHKKTKQVLVQKRTGKDIWQNLYEFFLIETAEKITPAELLLQEAIISYLPAKVEPEISPSFKQQLTHQTIHAVFIKISTSISVAPPGMFWASDAILKTLAFPRLINVFLDQSGVDKN